MNKTVGKQYTALEISDRISQSTSLLEGALSVFRDFCGSISLPSDDKEYRAASAQQALITFALESCIDGLIHDASVLMSIK